MPSKGGGGFSKSAAAKEAKTAAKEAAASKQKAAAEDNFWKEAGDGAKSKAAAKKEEQVPAWEWRTTRATQRAREKRGGECRAVRRANARATPWCAPRPSRPPHCHTLQLHPPSQARAKADAAKAKADAKREAEAAEAAELAKMNKANKAGPGSAGPKRSASVGKMTQHQLAKAAAADAESAAADAAARKMAARREVGHEDYASALEAHDPAAHREVVPGEGDVVDARSLSEAVSALGLDSPGGESGGDKHPERRAKAAYAAYCDRELPRLREEKPGLKLQQYKDMMWRAWQKDPANPFVAAALARGGV